MERTKRGILSLFSRDVAMTDGPILKNFIIYLVPLILSMLLQLAYNAVDLMVLGNFAGESAVASVGATTYIVNILVLLANMHVGYGMLLGRYFGKGDREKVKAVNSAAIVFTLAFGIISLVVGWVLAEPLLILTKCPESVIDGAVIYLRIYTLSIPGTFVYNFFSNLLRVSGDTRSPFVYLFISGLVNVGLNLLFVLGLNMPIEGVAIGTTASIYVSVALLLRKLMKREGISRLELSLRFSFGDLFKMLRYGLPNAISCCTFSIANVIIQSTINSYGDAAIAGSTASMTIENVIFGVSGTFTAAVMAFIAQNVGAGNRDRVIKIRRKAHGLSFVAITALCLIAILFGKPLISIFIPGATEAIEFGYVRLLYVALAAVLHSLISVNNGVLISFGYTSFQMLHNLFGIVVFRCIWLFWIYPISPTPTMLFMVYPISLAITATVGSVMAAIIVGKYKKGKNFAV